MKRILVSIGLSFAWVAIGYLIWAVVMRAHYQEGFEKATQGETLQSVLERLGPPSHIEPHYSAKGYDSGDRSVCGESCWLRLWYEMPLTLGTRQISFDIDSQQRVIRKYRWASP